MANRCSFVLQSDEPDTYLEEYIERARAALETQSSHIPLGPATGESATLNQLKRSAEVIKTSQNEVHQLRQVLINSMNDKAKFMNGLRELETSLATAQEKEKVLLSTKDTDNKMLNELKRIHQINESKLSA